jgi:hypothetical protein
MPGPITHLEAAYFYNNMCNKAFGGELYLGSISPDSVNINGHAPKQKRWPAHLRDQNLDKWIANAIAFYCQHKGTADEGFLRGYILHILTDIVWDKSFDMPLYNLLHNTGVPDDQLKHERWNEIYGYEQTQLKEKWLKKTVMPKLSSTDAKIIGTLKLSEVEQWRQKVVNLELPKGTHPRFVDKTMTEMLFLQVFQLAESIFD